MKTNTQNIARKIFFLFSFFYFLNTNAQAPDKMSYQAVVRNNSNTLVSNANVGIKISILQGTATGTEVYSQTQTATTNDNGLVSLTIGEGGFVSGDFVAINWGNGPYFIKTETDPTGGTSYTITSTTQLMSVPYALYAKTAGAANSWGLSGNAGTTDANFIGTTDDKDLQLKVNNQKAGVIETNDETTNNVKNANTGLGYQTLNANTTGAGNTSIGYQTLFSNIDGGSNTGVGHKTLYSNTVGYDNTAVGNGALYANTTGIENTATGYGALVSNTTGNKNSATGNSALYNNTTGSENTANGYQSLFSNTIGSYNVANGNQSLYSNTIGVRNVANGIESLYYNTTGNNNVAMGGYALNSITTGSNNIAIGAYAGEYIGNNSYGNIFLGTNAKATTNNTNLTNATAIGNKATVSQDNSIILGAVNGINGFSGETKVGIGVTAPLTFLDVNGQILTRDRVVLGQTAPTTNPATSPIWAMDNSNNNFRIFNQPNISSSGSTYLSIESNGKVNVTNNLNVGGYSKLGESSPNVKIKKLTGIINGNISVINLGVDGNKILMLDAFVTSGSARIKPYHGDGYGNYNYYTTIINGNDIIIEAYGSAGITSNKPITITIMYEE